MLKCILFILFFQITFGFSNQKSNFDIISDFNYQYSKTIHNLIIDKSVKEIEIVIKNDDLSNLLKNDLIKSFNKSKLLVSENSNIQIVLYNLNSGVFYQNYSECQDTIIRTIRYNFNGYFTDGNYITNFPDANYTFCDTVYRYNVDFFENKSVDFAHNKIPIPEQTFFQSIIEPVAVIATAALTVFLLFTLRTQ